ncbi:hypothetical protein PM082_021258, partial [Marasmius tenuissimus]
ICNNPLLAVVCCFSTIINSSWLETMTFIGLKLQFRPVFCQVLNWAVCNRHMGGCSLPPKSCLPVPSNLGPPAELADTPSDWKANNAYLEVVLVNEILADKNFKGIFGQEKGEVHDCSLCLI